MTPAAHTASQSALTYGVVALARPTFDVPYAEEMRDHCLEALSKAGVRVVGSGGLCFDAAAAEKALAEISEGGRIDLLLILQITFTDATMTVRMAAEAASPIAIWAVPEPRLGGRLRLNAFCGLNLAAHALGRAGRAFTWLYSAPEAAEAAQIRALAEPPQVKPTAASAAPTSEDPLADEALGRLKGAVFAVIGDHPAGFDTCEYDAALLQRLGDYKVNPIALPTLFDKARATDAARVAKARAIEAEDLKGIEDVDQDQLDRSLRVFCALEDVQAETGARGLAVRCWPEMFTEYGCAACGPMAMMNRQLTPSACEADVHGSLSQLLLQELAGEPAWMADMVDISADDDTAVLWHCGLAPLSMRDPQVQAEAQIHTNRRMPLLHQFPIKPGRVTLARLSKAKNEVKLMIAGAEVVRRPMAFTGTSGVVRFDRPAADVCGTIVGEGLEHHFALAYGDLKPALRAVASRWGLPVLELA